MSRNIIPNANIDLYCAEAIFDTKTTEVIDISLSPIIGWVIPGMDCMDGSVSFHGFPIVTDNFIGKDDDVVIYHLKTNNWWTFADSCGHTKDQLIKYLNDELVTVDAVADEREAMAAWSPDGDDPDYEINRQMDK